MTRSRRPDPETSSPQGDELERMFDRVSASVDEQLPGILEEIDEAAALFTEILGTPEPERRALLESGVRFHSLQLCQLLEERSRELWFSAPARAVQLADLAVTVAERLDDAHYGTLLAEDARASAWAHLGNALRIAANLRQAEEALQTAEEHHRRSSEDAYTEALILSFKASLRNTQGRYEEAARLLDGAITVYKQGRDRHEEGRALILKGTALGHAGRHQEAIRLIRRGLSRIDLLREPRLLVTARHNLIFFMTDGGRYQEAEDSLAETRRLYLELGERMNLVRLRWLEGKIARELGRLEDAEAALQEARDTFLADNIAIDAALVSLDLAILYMQRGEITALKDLAAEMRPVFESGDVHPEALAAILLFQQAAEAEQVTRALLDQVAARLQRTNAQ
jgi:tetratricopeptide (TPR) repeat protein